MNIKFPSIVLASAVVAASAVYAGERYAPIGYSIFCINNPGHCAPASAALVSHTDANMSKIASINAAVNASIRPKPDATEKWSLNPSAGDCEDYAITKRARLISAGFPAGALRIATTKTANGEPHAVLIVKTTDGDFVLDNLRRSTVRKWQSGYRFTWVASANPLRGE